MIKGNQNKNITFDALILSVVIFVFITLNNSGTSKSVFTSLREVSAQTADELQARIDDRNEAIANLEKDIKEYQKQLDQLSKEANTLSAHIKSLALTKKQLESKISLTQDKIRAKNDQIQQLGKQIKNKEGNIDYDKRIISQSFATINEIDKDSLVELILSGNSLSQSWNRLEQLSLLQKGVSEKIVSLNQDKTDLETNRVASEKAKAELEVLNKQLSSERAIILTTTAEQNQLLKQTNQSESSYKKMLAAKKAEAEAFEKEIANLETQLNILINPSSIPHTGSGVLSWPLANIFITQYFGNTAFATANPQIYNGKGHTGVDFRATIGTQVKSALAGEVIGLGNTDLYAGCASYGKWVMVKHNNGLSTLYAHLSLHSVKVGDMVETGTLLGYSGNTGYSTGPHLHFGVYATEGVRLQKFTTSRNCKGATIPIADYSAYLNPLSYL
ncbi:MAG: peptidoglycan DD-metalloendopeptidase family protein [Candidatus Paceibacterota bacterium]|jgi:murein DD-endopeptidase MepM/ murein hydrolase activator NlpD